MRHPLAPYLHLLEKPGRYLGGEKNSIYKEIKPDTLRIALVYPELYEIGMSNLGLRIIYHILNSLDYVYCERAFLPAPDAEEVMKREGVPLFSLETKTPLCEFDVVGISLHTELNYTNLLHTLKLSRIPLLREERDSRFPFITVGGPSALNPEPLKKFVDFFVIGEGEEVVREMADVLRAYKRREIGRDETLKELSKIKGIFVPEYPSKRVKRRFVDLKPEYFPVNQVVPHIEVVHDRFVIEIMRGCTRGCRFCEAGMVYRPLRIREVDEIIDLVKKGIRATGFEDISLLAFTVSDYPYLQELLVRLKIELGTDTFVSMPSLPVNAVTDELFSILKEMRRFSITLAPETVSQRLRAIVNKDVPLDEIYRSIEIAEKYGFRRIKLYFMIGLPGEEMKDVISLGEFVRELTRKSRIVDFRMSVSPFVPRPHTPFQWARQLTIEETEERIRVLKDITRRLRRLKLSWHDPRKSFLEGMLGRGDERLADVILCAYKNGARFDDRTEYFNFNAWKRAFSETGIDPLDYTRERDVEESLPWDYIDNGVYRDYLLREYRKAQKCEFTPNCMKGGCTGCGPWRKEGYRLCVSGIEDRVFEVPNVQVPRATKFRASYLLKYRKLKPIAYLSDVSTMILIVRALRRAGIKLRYSEGYVPRPKVSQSPSLYLGAESDSHILYFETRERYSPEEILRSLREELPDGLEPVCVVEAKCKPDWKKADSALYEIDLSGWEIDVNRLCDFFEHGIIRKGAKELKLSNVVIEHRFDGKKLYISTRLKNGLSVPIILSELLGISPDEARGIPVRRLYITIDGKPFNPCSVTAEDL